MVGVFVMIVVIAGALLVCRRKRRKKADIVAASEFAEPLENPTYLSGTYIYTYIHTYIRCASLIVYTYPIEKVMEIFFSEGLLRYSMYMYM